MPYAITIKEILSKTVVTNANTLEEAIEKVQSAYINGEIEIDLDITEVDIDASEYYKNGIISEEETSDNDYERIMNDKELWEEAQRIARTEYEKNYSSWDEADKYEKEDYVFDAYMELKGK